MLVVAMILEKYNCPQTWVYQNTWKFSDVSPPTDWCGVSDIWQLLLIAVDLVWYIKLWRHIIHIKIIEFYQILILKNDLISIFDYQSS